MALNIKTLTVLAVLLSVSINLFALRQEIGLRFQQARSEEEIIEIIKEYIEKTDDIDILRDLQETWIERDHPSCTAYFKELFDKNPDSKIFHYLWARSLEDEFTQRDEALVIIEKYPEFRYGYILLSFMYNRYLFHDTPGQDIDMERLRANFENDREYLVHWFNNFPKDGKALYTMYYKSLWEEDIEKAENYLLMSKDTPNDWINYFVVVDFCVTNERLKPFYKLFPDIIHRGIVNGSVAPEDSLALYASYYMMILRTINRYEKIDEYLNDNLHLYELEMIRRRLVNIYIDQELYELAIGKLHLLLDAGLINYANILREENWAPLSQVSGWLPFIEKAKRLWDEGEEARKEVALSDRKDMPAPDWQLESLQGETIKLSDYRGETVIILFWSIRSEPCMVILPEVDEWNQSLMIDNVKIFAVNLMGTDAPHVARYVADNRFNLTFLNGTDNLAALYRIRELPHIAVIDKDGIIRYTLEGLSDNLKEILTWWVENVD